jgi:predicted nucleic acid-binding protein
VSYAIDANVLLYASDESATECAKARDFLRGCVESGEVFFLAWLTVIDPFAD